MASGRSAQRAGRLAWLWRRPRPHSRRAQGPPCASGRPAERLQPGVGRRGGSRHVPVFPTRGWSLLFNFRRTFRRDWRGLHLLEGRALHELRHQLVVRLRTGDEAGHFPSPIIGVTHQVFVPQPETLVRVRRVRVPPLRVPSKPELLGSTTGARCEPRLGRGDALS